MTTCHGALHGHGITIRRITDTMRLYITAITTHMCTPSCRITIIVMRWFMSTIAIMPIITACPGLYAAMTTGRNILSARSARDTQEGQARTRL